MKSYREYMSEAEQSYGTIDQYLSGDEPVKWDRTSTRGSNLVGSVRLSIDGGSKKVEAYALDRNYYGVYFNIDNKKFRANGPSAKKAFLNLLQQLKTAGYK